MEWYWKPQFYKNGFPIIKKNKSDENDFLKDAYKIQNLLENPRKHSDAEKEEYNNKIIVFK